MPVDVSHFGRKMKGVVSWDRSKEEQVEKEVSVKQPTTEPTRIKIFEGGYVQHKNYSSGRDERNMLCKGFKCSSCCLSLHCRSHHTF